MTKPDDTAERVVRLDDRTFDGWIAGHGPLALVLVRSQACCQSLEIEAQFKEMADRSAGRAHLATIDMDESPETMKKHRVDGAPALLIFRGSDEEPDICRSCGVLLPTLSELLGLTEREVAGARH